MDVSCTSFVYRHELQPVFSSPSFSFWQRYILYLTKRTEGSAGIFSKGVPSGVTMVKTQNAGDACVEMNKEIWENARSWRSLVLRCRGAARRRLRRLLIIFAAPK